MVPICIHPSRHSSFIVPYDAVIIGDPMISINIKSSPLMLRIIVLNDGVGYCGVYTVVRVYASSNRIIILRHIIIIRIIVSNNSASDDDVPENYNSIAGGIYSNYGIYPTISNSIIENNYAEHKGGGLYVDGNHGVTYNNCIIRNNEAGMSGGVYADGYHTTQFTMNDCEITENISTSTADNNYDVMIFNTFHLKNTLIAGNSRPVYLTSYPLGDNIPSLENVTITHNGGGVRVEGGNDVAAININNTITPLNTNSASIVCDCHILK
jgi:hypothetical protein